MAEFALKIINDRLVIDLDKMTEDYSESYGYDGKPSKYDIGEIGCAEPFAVIELSEHQVNKLVAEYENGGECGWCGEVSSELCRPHLFDFAPGEKMCRNCWNHDREMYKGSTGEDIGEFVPNLKENEHA